ncbi:hypothetical protein [Sorangium sp. So ce1078]|uniref:hypothetical protein n=1 Tax=Sorangium sp. So ce1078 TaxID=3133329 RepID=UPI003F60F0CE
MIVDGTPVTGRRPDGAQAELELGLNPITIDARDEWVYYGAMHGASVYRVRTRRDEPRRSAPRSMA